MEVKVRIIRTYEVAVTAEYGDTEDSLEQRGAAAITDDTDYAETVVVVPPDHGD